MKCSLNTSNPTVSIREDMNLCEMDKIRLMMCVVSLAYVLCLKEGEIQNELKPVSMKKSTKTQKTWKNVSLFRLKLRQLKPIFKELTIMIDYIYNNINRNISINQILIKKLTILKLKSVQ